VELISEEFQHLLKRQETGVTDFIRDWMIGIMVQEPSMGGGIHFSCPDRDSGTFVLCYLGFLMKTLWVTLYLSECRSQSNRSRGIIFDHDRLQIPAEIPSAACNISA
jgi:hypothetical protein